ncbi:PKD domain-containing protein [Flaviaesturariibacter flavus]|uniref:PKD domain-containing protein n=1 Tax=Flaviaesturariibacter flavus TaxID=2502780 RepID=A0A4R1BN46_9BACT|nr:PKD domain-containing protein [Flaviaesturariibacter flavus]TCJ19000.1 PKD domain-containing protein [Flaviaesturariibacter flavus]
MKPLIARLLLLLLLCTGGLKAMAQDFSNKGKEFWLAYSYHVGMQSGTGLPQMTLYLTSDVTTTYNVAIFGGANLASGTLTAGSVVQVTVPTTYMVNDEGLFLNRAIRVTADKPIVVYSYITRSAASAATLCLPVPVLGKEYMTTSFTQVSNEPGSNSYITIVAVDSNTTVEIKPTAATKSGWAAGSTQIITLQKGQVYQVLGFENNAPSGGTYSGVDLSGTTVRSISSGTGGCKRIAVFSGSGKIRIPQSGCSNNSSDNLYQQLYPISTWGKKYLTVPSKNNPFNYYRIYRSVGSANITLNGTPIPAGSFVNNYYTLPVGNVPNRIESDQPISVVQYFTTQGCNGNPSGKPYDPDMIVLNPVEQNINKVTLVSSNLAAASTAQYPHQHHIHVIIPNTGTAISSFRFDGNPVPASIWTVHPADPSYSYAYMADISGGGNTITQGYHTLASDSGFLALAYGYANAESYGYSAGANVKDLYQYAGIRNQYATVNFPATCRNTPFKFSMTFPYQPTQIQWQFNGLFSDVTVNTPVADSVFLVNGKTLYRYTLAGTYVTPNIGTFPIRILAQNPTTDGCAGEQEINYDLQVIERPKTEYTMTTSGCVTDPVQFADGSNSQGRTIVNYFWSFGAGGYNPVTQANTSFTFPTAGSYTINHFVVTDIGCVSDTLPKTLTLAQPPAAGFDVVGPYCEDSPLTFTDQSSGNGSSITQWSWDFGDGSTPVTLGSGVAQQHLFANPGTYVVSLVVKSSGCTSTAFTKTITVNPRPAAGFTFGNACLPTGALAFTNSSTVTAGGPLTYAWSFGPAGAVSASANPIYNYATVGPHQVELIAKSAAGCSDTSRQTVNTVYAAPTSAFGRSVSPIDSLYCPNSAMGLTSMALSPGSSTSEWHWSFGDGNTSTAMNPVIAYPTPGTYIIKHWVISAIGCVSDTTRDTVTIVPPPVSSFTVNALRCERDTLRALSVSTPGAGALTQYKWEVNGSPAGTTSALAYLPATAGNYTIRLQVGSNINCEDDTTIVIAVHPKPVPDFTLPNVCLPAGTATFTNTSGIAGGTTADMSYQWSFGNGNTATTVNGNTTYSTTGPFNVKLTATSNNGCVQDTVKVLSTVYAEPKALFSINAGEVCIGAAFTFTDASTAPASTVTGWNWSFGDGTFSTSQNPVKTYLSPGTYTVRLQVTSAIGCVSAFRDTTVTVNRLPSPAFGTSAVLCATRAITFTDASTANSGILQSWSWDFGDGSTVQTGQGPQQHAYPDAGNYGVSLTVVTDKGCTATRTDTVRVHQRPRAGFVIPQNCLADPYSQFTDTSSVTGPDAISGWLWNFGDALANPASSNFSVLQNPRHRYTAVGPYRASLEVVTNFGCRDTIRQDLFVSNTSPVPVLAVLQGAVCSNDSVRIKDSSWVDIGNIVRLDIWWDAADPSSVQTVLNPVLNTVYAHRYPEFFSPANRDLNIKLVAYSGTTCAIDVTRPLRLLATPEVRFAPLTDVCANVPSFSFNQGSSANSAVVPGQPLYSGAGVNAAGLFNPRTAGIGIHDITYTFRGNNGCVNDSVHTIEVFDIPTVDAGPDKFVLEGGVDSLLGSGVGSNVRYLWSPARFLNTDTVAHPAVRPADDQLYTLTVTSEEGCFATDQVFVKLLRLPVIPNVFTPNGDGVNDRWVINHLESYPGATVEVYNRYGQLVFRSVNYTTAWDGTLNGQLLPTGTYYYIINPKNGRKQMTGFVDLIR